MIGLTGVTGKLQAAYRVDDIRPIKGQLDKLVQRRHWIVHEGDLVRHKRAGKLKLHPLERRYVADSLHFVDTLVGHLDRIR